MTEILARWLAAGWQIAVQPSSDDGWYCRVREGERSWTRAGSPADFHATPDEAVAAADAFLAALVAGREQARATELLATLDGLLTAGRLTRRERALPGGEREVVWVATLLDRSETEPAPSPVEAARRAHHTGRRVGENRIGR